MQDLHPMLYPQKRLGVSFHDLGVSSVKPSRDYQHTFGNYALALGHLFSRVAGNRRRTTTYILRDFDGLVESGEMLVVLGRPGSGCSTLLKALSGDTHGFSISNETKINYQGESSA